MLPACYRKMQRACHRTIIASVKTLPHVTLSIPMNHRCHGVMAGHLTSDVCHDKPLLSNDATVCSWQDATVLFWHNATVLFWNNSTGLLLR